MNGQSRRLKPIARRRARDSSGAPALPKAMKLSMGNEKYATRVLARETSLPFADAVMVRASASDTVRIKSFDPVINSV